MHKNARVEILRLLQKHDVPLQHGVALICKTQGLGLSALAGRCGYQRNDLYKALSGELSPAPAFRAAVAEQLGIDPWQYAPPAHRPARHNRSSAP